MNSYWYFIQQNQKTTKHYLMKGEEIKINWCKQFLLSLEKKWVQLSISICQEDHFLKFQILGAVPIVCQEFKPASWMANL